MTGDVLWLTTGCQTKIKKKIELWFLFVLSCVCVCVFVCLFVFFCLFVCLFLSVVCVSVFQFVYHIYLPGVC